MKKWIIGVLSFGVAALGGTSNCPTASLLNEVPPISGATAPGAMPAGCAAVEVTFNSFGSSGAVNGITNPGLSASDAYLFKAGAGILNSSNASTFAAAGGFSTGSAGTDGLAADFMNNPMPTVAIGSTPFNNASYGITESSISGSFPVMTTLGAFVEPIFVVAAFGSPTATVGACTQLGLLTGSCTSGGKLISGLFPLMTSTNPFSMPEPLQPTFMDPATAITLASSNGTVDPSFLTFDDPVDAAPEPSTIILLGTAIACIGLLRRKITYTLGN